MNKPNFSWFAQLAAVLWVGLICRAYLALATPLNHDTAIWITLKDAWAMGQSPYSSRFHYIYAVPWFFIISLTSWLANAAQFPFAIAIKFPLILTDVVIFFLLIACGRKLNMSRPRALACASFFFLNPISMLTSSVHGQFDNLSILFLLLAWFVLTFKKNNSLLWGCLCLSLSVWVKHFTAMIAFVIGFSRKKWAESFLVVAAAPALFVLSFLPFWRDFGNIYENILRYNLHGGYWGWSGVICRGWLLITGYDLMTHPMFHYLDYFNGLFYVMIIVFSWWAAKRYALLDAILLIFLFFYTFTTQIGIQYTLWLLPFAVLRPNRYLLAYTIVGGVQLAAFYYCHYHWWLKIPMEGPLFSKVSETFVIFRYLTWAVGTLWLIHSLRHAERLQSKRVS